MAIPTWANPDISELLPKIRGEGEGQAYDFKETFPDKHKLAKSVAAFATAGGGLILIGVRNDGTVAGFNEADLDGLYHQAQSIIEQVRPAVEHRISVCYDEGNILVICIHQDQKEPVFYYDDRAYIRVGRTSRRATPEEVKSKVWEHPSSAQRLRDEELKHDMKKAAWELSIKRTADADAASAKSMENILRTNDMLRQSVIPK